MISPEYVKGLRRIDVAITLRDGYSHYGIVCDDQREFKARVRRFSPKYTTVVIEYKLTGGTLTTALSLDDIEKICPVDNHAT